MGTIEIDGSQLAYVDFTVLHLVVAHRRNKDSKTALFSFSAFRLGHFRTDASTHMDSRLGNPGAGRGELVDRLLLWNCRRIDNGAK